MATKTGVWNLQQVRDKYLQELWENKPQLFTIGGGYDGVMGAVAPAYDLSLSSEDFFTTFIFLLQN